jgi:hypothetical protein
MTLQRRQANRLNWAAIAAVSSLAGLVGSLLVGAFVYGKLTQEVKETRDKTGDHAVTLKEHSDTLVDHGQKISRIQEWKDGVKFGSLVAGSKDGQ